MGTIYFTGRQDPDGEEEIREQEQVRVLPELKTMTSLKLSY